MKNLFLMFLLAFTVSACSMMGMQIDYADGTWSDCTYSKEGRVVVTPLQVGGRPMSWEEPDGTKVSCVPIPKSAGEVK